MENNYPSFESKNIKKEYSEKINKFFEEKNFKWIASPAPIHPNIFIRPNDSLGWEISRMYAE